MRFSKEKLHALGFLDNPITIEEWKGTSYKYSEFALTERVPGYWIDGTPMVSKNDILFLVTEPNIEYYFSCGSERKRCGFRYVNEGGFSRWPAYSGDVVYPVYLDKLMTEYPSIKTEKVI